MQRFAILASVVGIISLVAPEDVSGQAANFTGVIHDTTGGFFTGDGTGCAAVRLEVEEIVPPGGSATPVVGVSLSFAHDAGLVTVDAVEPSPALVSALGFTPEMFVHMCTGGCTIGIVFAPDLITTPTPLTLAGGIDLAIVRYQTVPASFIGVSTSVLSAVTWMPNACGAAIPVQSAVSTVGGAGQIGMTALIPGTLTMTPGIAFIRGDANGDGGSNPTSPVNIADAIFILGYLFSAGPAPSCMQAADANDDEDVNLADAVFILAGLFSGGPPPPPPYPTCGSDPTPGALSCIGFPSCCPAPPAAPQFTGLTHAGANAEGYQEYTLDLDPTVVMILIPGVTFDMGQVGVATPVHPVTLSPYLIAKSEITNAQYQAYCTATGTPVPTGPYCCGMPSDHFTNPLYADHPVVNVSWFDVAGYCAWAGLALPTEAQWEYTARGTDGRSYPWGNEAPDAGGVDRANYSGSSDGFLFTNPVDASNYFGFEGPFGTVGQAGNVWEWCSDWFGAYPSGPVTDPTGPPTGSYRVYRGGSWNVVADSLQSAVRYFDVPSIQYGGLGFRPARVIP